ncbi:MAG: GNAT family N-acetyltransferase [Pseudomonadota bacterium]
MRPQTLLNQWFQPTSRCDTVLLMSGRIRKATPEDVDAVRSIVEAAYEPYVAAIGRKPAPMVADFAAQIAKGHIWVIERQSIDGFIVFYPRSGLMFLENVAIHPEARGHGLGRDLINHCERMAREQGFKRIELYANAKMTANHNFYRRLGFEQTDRRFEDGFDRIYFRKALF